MYTTCLFCNSDLGKNEVIEDFPVGRRLAFDPAKGRLWVVCRRCERWNLTPLEERWEAIEACEREFRGTTLRVSTDEIGLARLREGLELVRIGAPQRPEMAAWRYGDQFGRRRRRYYTYLAGGVAVAATVVVAGPMLGLIGAGAINPAFNLLNAGRGIYRSRKTISVPIAEGESMRTRLHDLDKVRFLAQGDQFVLRVPVKAGSGLSGLTTSVPWYMFDRGKSETFELQGEAAIRAAGALLPSLNQSGGSANDVQRAVRYLDEAGAVERLYRNIAATPRPRGWNDLSNQNRTLLKNIPTAARLALEMAAHEDTERRALEGELYLLENAWRDAEEIAGIADDLLVPESVNANLARLKAERDGREP